MTGLVPVRVIVTGPVASVASELDGRPLGTMRAPAWSADVDLGPELSPHKLAARALDPDGKTLASSRQWLNLPRPPAEVEVVLERGADGRAQAARLSWQSLATQQPKAVEAKLNGKPLTVSPDRRLQLPKYDPEQPQVLSVELEFENDVRARKDLVLGGRTGEEAGSELTAIPVRVHPRAAPPTAASLQGSLTARAVPVHVAAVEEGNGALLIVRDYRAVRVGRWPYEFSPIVVDGEEERYRFDMSLAKTDVRILWPRPAEYSGGEIPVELFRTSHEFDTKVGGLRWILTRMANPKPEPRPPKFADAVAVAALNAYGTFRRRAVLLVLQPDLEDASQYRPDMVRHFLANLRVPLFVWSIGPCQGAAAAWTESVDVSSEQGLQKAFVKIRDELAAQRIVWVQGKILPQDVGLADNGKGIELVR